MNPTPNVNVSLNLNEIPQSERHSRVFEEFDRMRVGDAMEISVSHEPKLLQKQFMTLREGAYTWEVLQASGDAWRIRISKTQEITGEQTKAKVQGCCGSCGGH